MHQASWPHRLRTKSCVIKSSRPPLFSPLAQVVKPQSIKEKGRGGGPVKAVTQRLHTNRCIRRISRLSPFLGKPPSRLGLLSRVLGSWAIQLCAVPSSGLAVLEPPAVLPFREDCSSSGPDVVPGRGRRCISVPIWIRRLLTRKLLNSNRDDLPLQGLDSNSTIQFIHIVLATVPQNPKTPPGNSDPFSVPNHFLYMPQSSPCRIPLPGGQNGIKKRRLPCCLS